MRGAVLCGADCALVWKSESRCCCCSTNLGNHGKAGKEAATRRVQARHAATWEDVQELPRAQAFEPVRDSVDAGALGQKMGECARSTGVVDEEGEEEADQEEEVGGVWLVGSVDELRDGWRRSEATDARRLMQTEIDTVQQIWCRSRRRTHLN